MTEFRIPLHNIRLKLAYDDFYYIYKNDKLYVDENGEPILFRLKDMGKLLNKIIEIKMNEDEKIKEEIERLIDYNNNVGMVVKGK